MKKTVVKEFLFEQEDELEPKKHKDVDLEDELVYFVDMEDSLGEDPDYAKTFYESLKEFGVDKKDVAIIGSYGADADWEDIKNELDRCQIEYYEFDDINASVLRCPRTSTGSHHPSRPRRASSRSTTSPSWPPG